jgi:HTH-type transcriptional repressor of NAD biosynthesis genes
VTDKKWNNALVIGKFYPFHNGHLYLVEQAARVAHTAYVLIYESEYQSISGESRRKWMKDSLAAKGIGNVRIFVVRNDVYEDYEDQNIWHAHDVIMLSAMRVNYIENVDVVVSSEDYGNVLAKTLGCEAHIVDLNREAFPVSGTAVRTHFTDNWKHLPLATRKDLIPRVIVVGAESTGTTTLSKALTEHYNARYVPEYGREYTIDWLDAKRLEDPSAQMEDLVWQAADFIRIGQKQLMLENRAAKQLEGFPLVIGDTDSWATTLWEARYLTEDRFELTWKSVFSERPYGTNLPTRDLYILTDDVGVPFEDDGYRDGAHLRSKMTLAFEDALTSQAKPWILVSGSHEDRMRVAIRAIDKILDRKFVFGEV